MCAIVRPICSVLLKIYVCDRITQALALHCRLDGSVTLKLALLGGICGLWVDLTNFLRIVTPTIALTIEMFNQMYILTSLHKLSAAVSFCGPPLS